MHACVNELKHILVNGNMDDIQASNMKNIYLQLSVIIKWQYDTSIYFCKILLFEFMNRLMNIRMNEYSNE